MNRGEHVREIRRENSNAIPRRSYRETHRARRCAARCDARRDGRTADALRHLAKLPDADEHGWHELKYQDEEAIISIPDGNLIEGAIQPNKMKLLLAWIEIHKDELMADWDLAISGQTIFKIDPLK